MFDWTDVNEELPEDGQLVLITGLRDGTSERYTHIAYYDEDKESFFAEDYEDGQNWEFLNVTHWQLLPDTEELDE
jgi:hypothetical protein